MTEFEAMSLAQRIQESGEPLWRAIKRLFDEKEKETEATVSAKMADGYTAGAPLIVDEIGRDVEGNGDSIRENGGRLHRGGRRGKK